MRSDVMDSHRERCVTGIEIDLTLFSTPSALLDQLAAEPISMNGYDFDALERKISEAQRRAQAVLNRKT